MAEPGGLPPFPVDDTTLDLLWRAIHPAPPSDRSSMNDLLTLYSQLGGSDTDAVAEQHGDIHMMRDQRYHIFDVMVALIEEIRRLRGGETK